MGIGTKYNLRQNRYIPHLPCIYSMARPEKGSYCSIRKEEAKTRERAARVRKVANKRGKMAARTRKRAAKISKRGN